MDKDNSSKLSSDEKAAVAKTSFFTQNFVAVIVALIGLFGSLIATAYRGILDLEIKKRESEQALIMKAVENTDLEQSRKNLEFFIKAGFISDPHGRILKLVQDTVKQSIPVISTVPPIQSDAPYIIAASSDKDMVSAKYELEYAAREFKLPSTLYKRNGYFCVLIGNYDSREMAKEDLLVVQKRYKTAYIASLNKWCSSLVDKKDYFECE